jgi:crotonobetainyl-CoA:carnitine CoA-transferase CaiB-like acyl-CoA transferase
MRLAEVAVADPDAAWAASGAIALTGRPEGPPLAAPASVITGLARLAKALAEKSGVEVDGPALLGERAAHAGLRRAGAVSCGGRTRLLCAADGWVAVSLARPDDVGLLPAWLGADATEATLAGLIRARRARPLVASAALLGLPVSRLGESAGREPMVATPMVATPTVATPMGGTGAAAGRPLTVIDLSSLWAGPLCGQLLTQAGLRVIKVESSTRPDGARLGPPGFFDLLHAGQESVALDFTVPAGRAALAGLVAAADVVIEASRPRALSQLGVGPSPAGPRVWVSITGYGRAGNDSNRVAFGDDAAVAGGLVVCDEAGPCFCADAVSDPATGLYAAVAALAALEDGRRWRLDIRLAGVAAWLARPAGRRPGTQADGPVAPPRSRPAAGRAAPLGEHTDAVLAEFGVARTAP